MVETPTAFISYSHDSPEHDARVLDLANRLRQDGVDVALDRFVTSPPEGWPMWMERQIARAKFVLIVCTETYNRRVSGEAAARRGQGVRWESQLTYNDIYGNDSLNHRFIPVLMSESARLHIPMPLRGATYYDLSSDAGYLQLYRRLTNQPAIVSAPLGTVRRLSADPPAVAPAAEATPAGQPKRSALRNVVMNVLISDSDFDAFCLDYYRDVYRTFSGGMDRIQKANRLLDYVELNSGFDELLKFLAEANPRGFAKHQYLLNK